MNIPFRSTGSRAASAGVVLLVLASAGTVLADPIPTGWTCNGVCGSLANNGVVTSPTTNSSYQYATTAGSTATAPLPTGALGSETNGSTLATSVFSANAGTALNFYFNYITSDGSGYADYAWAELFHASGTPASLLFTARTEPSGSIVPGTGLPAPNATLTPASVPIIPGGPIWSPLGADSGSCFAPGCGYTGWIDSTYSIPTAGDYYLEIGVTNWQDKIYDSGIAMEGVSVGGIPITPPSPVPEPSTFLLLGSGLACFASTIQRKLRAA